jgi:hypothetical protein
VPRRPNPPNPSRHASVCHQICQRVGVDGKTLTIERTEGRSMTFKEAHAFKQQFLRFRDALSGAVKSGDNKWETLLAQADLVAIGVKRLPDGLGSVTFYNRERTPFARTLEEALLHAELS